MRKYADRFSEIIWSGKVRPMFQTKVWNVAARKGTEQQVSSSGNMVTSSETHTIHLLDGGVQDSRGYFDGSCGMTISGDKCLQFILYEIGEKPSELLVAGQKIWSRAELRREIRTGNRA